MIAYARSNRHTRSISQPDQSAAGTVLDYAIITGVFGSIVLLTNRGASAWLYGVLAVLVCAALLVYRQRYIKPSRAEIDALGEVPGFPESTARVACVGDLWALARLARRGTINDHAFEPVAIRGVATGRSGSNRYWALCVAFVFSFAALLIADWTIGWRLGLWCMLWPAIALAAMIVAATWPSYARLVPGRLDVLHSNALGRAFVHSESFDLRTSAVLVDLNQRCVFLAKDGITTEIGFGAVRDPYEFAHAVLLAAISTHDPAPLPDDALVG